MSETQQQHGRPEDEPISSPLPLENLEQQVNPAAGSGTSPAADSEPKSTPAGVNESVIDAESVATAPGEMPPAIEVETPEVAASASYGSEAQVLAAKLTEVSNQRDAFQSQYLRIAADFDNFRKRSSKEKEDIEVRVKCTTLVELLSVVDNFERARTQIKPQNDGEMGIHKSYQGVYKQLVESLKRIGVSPMRPEGQQFDPNLHEAVMREPTEDHPEGTVMEELQRGYYLGDRILRHSLVKVAAPPEQLSADDAVSFDTGN
jgi:molecular chaperone GrpE